MLIARGLLFKLIGEQSEAVSLFALLSYPPR
jgi:hypothetical protein